MKFAHLPLSRTKFRCRVKSRAHTHTHTHTHTSQLIAPLLDRKTVCDDRQTDRQTDRHRLTSQYKTQTHTRVRGAINFCLPKCSHDTIEFKGIMTTFRKAEVDTPSYTHTPHHTTPKHTRTKKGVTHTHTHTHTHLTS